MNKQVKLITCAGYYGTGSSAVTDLLGEFDNIHYMGDFEFRFVQDPGGIADLEYNLVENYHRHNSGHALKRFKKNVDFWSGNKLIKKYERFFYNQFKRISYNYIEGLTLLKYKGYWHQDVIDKGYWFYFLERILEKSYNKIICPFIFGRGNKDIYSIHILRNEWTYVPYYDKVRFYDLTKSYIDKLFSVANSNDKEFVMVDQLVPPTNSEKYLRYFNDLKIISVDRDPRDLYILERLVWKGGVVPTDDINQYCDWYKNTRMHRKYENDDKSKVLRINFEDLVYHYKDTTNIILDFLGIDIAHHCSSFKYFDPNYSRKNTKLWEKHKELEKEIKIIENVLEEYCYKDY